MFAVRFLTSTTKVPACRISTPRLARYTKNSPRRHQSFASESSTHDLLFEDHTAHAPLIMDTLEIYPPPHSAHKDCSICEQHFLSVEDQKSEAARKVTTYNDHDAQLLLNKMRLATLQDIKHFYDLLLSHGDVILSRWKKYSRVKREKLLSEASMFFRLPPRKVDAETNPFGPRPMVHEAIPGLVTDGFFQDYMKLLSLLHVRSEYLPDRWAAFDCRSTHFSASQSRSKEYMYNPGAVIMYGEQYGELVDFDVDSAHSWQQVGFPRAAHTLLIQQVMAKDLSAIVDLIVADAKPTGNDKWTALISKGLRSAHEEALWNPYFHQEFAPPATFDVDVVLGKVRNHLNALVDETELMQTNPDHMRQCVSEARAQTFSQSKGCQKVGQDWTALSRIIANGSSNGLVSWLAVLAEAENLKTKLVESGCSTMPGAVLTRDADTAMRCFGKTISEMLLFVVQEEALIALRSIKILHDFCSRGAEMYKKSPESIVRLTDEINTDPSKPTHRIMAYMHRMQNLAKLDGEGEEYNLLPYMKMLRYERRSVAYNSNVENCLSSMALLDELRTLWYWRQIAVCQNPPTEKDLWHDIATRGILNGAKTQQTCGNLARAKKLESQGGQLLRKFCELPIAKGPRNVSWLEKMDAARESLTEFWQCVREHWNISQMEFGRPNPDTMMMSRMSFDISSEYLAKVEAERQCIKDEDRREGMLKAQQHNKAQFIQQSWDIGAGKDDVVRRKISKKSNALRSDASVEDALQDMILDEAPVDEDALTLPEPTLTQRIAVKQDTLSLVAKMFPTGSDGTNGVRWVQLVQALSDAGMTPTQGAGSAVVFSTDRGSISLHKPHPEPVVDAIVLRGFGKRLNKWFGWNNATFVLRHKDCAGIEEALSDESAPHIET